MVYSERFKLFSGFRLRIRSAPRRRNANEAPFSRRRFPKDSGDFGLDDDRRFHPDFGAKRRRKRENRFLKKFRQPFRNCYVVWRS